MQEVRIYYMEEFTYDDITNIKAIDINILIEKAGL